jgi:hypothetical protein
MNCLEVHRPEPPLPRLTLQSAAIAIACLPILPFLLFLRFAMEKYARWRQQMIRERATWLAQWRGRDLSRHHAIFRETEWGLLLLLERGARQVFAGRPVDLEDMGAMPDIDPGWHCPMPRTAEALYARRLRMNAIMCDPIRAIEAYAANILIRERRRAINASFAARLMAALRETASIFQISNPELAPECTLSALRPP